MYHAGDGSGPTRPMTHAEMTESYGATKPDDLLALADLYIDFQLVEDVEFQVFRDRLSAAVLMSELASSSLRKLGADRERLRATGDHRLPGWEFEADVQLEAEEHWIATTAQSLMFGGAAMAAVSALEALIDDLRTDDMQLGGLQRKAQRYLVDCRPPPEVRARIDDEVLRLARARNAYAHALDGSPWSDEQHKFDGAECDRVFRLVGRLAVELTRLRDTNGPS